MTRQGGRLRATLVLLLLMSAALFAIGEWWLYLLGESPRSDIVGMTNLAILAAGIAVVMHRLAFHPRLVIDGNAFGDRQSHSHLSGAAQPHPPG